MVRGHRAYWDRCRSRAASFFTRLSPFLYTPPPRLSPACHYSRTRGRMVTMTATKRNITVLSWRAFSPRKLL